MFFRVDLKIFIFLVILYFTKQIEIYSFIMMFAFLHELGHLLAGIMLKMKVKRMSIMPTGFSIEFELEESDYNKKILKSNMLEVKKIIIAIAGPLVNLIVIIIMLFSNSKNESISNIIYANFLILIFNLLPIYPLDGGRILKSILCLMKKRKNSILYTNKVSNMTLFMVSFLFSILIYYYKNWSIIVILTYLWYIVIKENRISRMKLRLYDEINRMELINKKWKNMYN